LKLLRLVKQMLKNKVIKTESTTFVYDLQDHPVLANRCHPIAQEVLLRTDKKLSALGIKR
jgi:hypothetical protein